MDKKKFVKMLLPYIRKYVQMYGYNDVVEGAIVAQAACESAWGDSSLAKKYHNYFGMKCGSSWKGSSINMATKEEYTPGTLTKIKDNFRAYDCLENGIAGYFDFIKAKRYSPLKKCATPEEYIKALKACGWATSSTYVKTLTNLYYTVAPLIDESGQRETGREEVNTDEYKIEAMARDVIRGAYGNGSRRRAMLGPYYQAVQARVNEILKRTYG